MIKKGGRVLIVDDLLATGGTAVAACKLVGAISYSQSRFSFLLPPLTIPEMAGGVVVSCGFIVELGGMPVGKEGRKILEAEGREVYSLVKYDS